MKKEVFITNKGLICTDAAHIIPVTPENRDYLDEIRHEAAGLHRNIASPQEEADITIDIKPDELIDKLSDVQLDKLPKEVVEACRSLPEFKVRQLLDDVAKGKQDEARTILDLGLPEDKQMLLTTAGKFTDYSGRTFHCTAYEYAYWAKDKHMMRMLEGYMEDGTKKSMLKKIEDMEERGLSYQQHGIAYQNAHYDMSFVLKNLSADEFQQLQSMLGKNIKKIHEASIDKYKNISFTATEFENLKKELVSQHVTCLMPAYFSNVTLLCYITYPIFYIISCFMASPSPAQILSNKLDNAFDFHSLITALHNYVTNYVKWDFHQRLEAWKKVGQAQKDVPAHVAHEYCRPDRSFAPLPSFDEENLPRILELFGAADRPTPWFPLKAFDFSVMRGPGEHALKRWSAWDFNKLYVCPQTDRIKPWCIIDFEAVYRLDEVRINDLAQSRENLSHSPNQFRAGY